MTRRLLPVILPFALCLVVPSTARAQQAPGNPDPEAQVATAPPPASISFVEGTATLERDGQAEQAAANMPVVPGDRLRTETGRVEILLPDGSLLHVDQNSALDLLSPSLVRLLQGQVILLVAGSLRDRPSVDYQIDAVGGSVQVLRPGEYRMSVVGAAPGRTLALRVGSGEANLFNERGTIAVEAGERSEASEDQAPAAPLASNSARWDAFDQWSDQRRGDRTGTTSTRYLPTDLQQYSGTFDRYGQWDYEADYGYVWSPHVAADWRPYYSGYWDDVGSYGWTWIGRDPWAWPTHHFGRWGWRRNSWFWIPGVDWAAAWVSWALAPGFVSWCPLGWDNRPVFGFGLGSRAFYRDRFNDPWRAWTVIPRRAFGLRTHVSSVAVRGATLPATTRRSFVMEPRLSIPGAARSRSAVVASGRPLPSGRAVPRGGADGVSPRAGPRSPATVSGRARPGYSAGPVAPRGGDQIGSGRQPGGSIRPPSVGGRTPAGRYGDRPPSATPRGATPYSPQFRQPGIDGNGARPSAPSRAPGSPSGATTPGYATPRAAPSYTSSPRYAPSNPRSATPVPGSSPPMAAPATPRPAPTSPRSAPSAAPAAPGPAPSSPRYTPRSPGSSPSYSRPAPSYPRSAPSAAPSYPRSAPSYSAPSYPRSAPSYSRSAPSYSRSAPSYSRSAPSYSRSAPSYSRSAPSYSGSARSYSRSAPSAAPRSAPSGGHASRSAPSGGGQSRGGQARSRR